MVHVGIDLEHFYGDYMGISRSFERDFAEKVFLCWGIDVGFPLISRLLANNNNFILAWIS